MHLHIRLIKRSTLHLDLRAARAIGTRPHGALSHKEMPTALRETLVAWPAPQVRFTHCRRLPLSSSWRS